MGATVMVRVTAACRTGGAAVASGAGVDVNIDGTWVGDAVGVAVVPVGVALGVVGVVAGVDGVVACVGAGVGSGVGGSGVWVGSDVAFGALVLVGNAAPSHPEGRGLRSMNRLWYTL